MKKEFLSILIAVMLIFGITALADGIDAGITETETGLSVSFTAPESGGIYVIGAEYDGMTLKKAAVWYTDNAVQGEKYTAELTGIGNGASIFIWDDNQKPLCDKQYYGEPIHTAAPTAEPENSSAPTNAPTDNPGNIPTGTPTATPTIEPENSTAPTNAPTDNPGNTPTVTPTAAPTTEPEQSPAPTNAPTDNPENTPTATPTAEPDNTPDPNATPTPIPEGDGIIHLKNTEIDASGVDGAEVDGTTVTITAGGDYIIEGTLSDGQIVVSDALGKKDAVNIELRGVNVTCSNSAPFNAGGGKIGITLADGTTNTFTDTSAYTGYTTSKDPKGCFYSKRDLDIGGAGTLKVSGNVKNGMVCGADMKIKKNANLDVTAVNNAVKGDNGVEFTDKTGTVTITSTGGDGIKSDAIDTDIVTTGAIEADKGYVTIAGGTFDITAAGDGIQADNYCTITGGDITINSGTEGIKANEVNLPVIADDAVVADQYVNGKITISGGTLDVTSGEDGIKATESVTVSETADITVTATGTDAIDGSGYDGIQAGETTDAVSGNTTTETVVVAGVVTISGGTVDITASDDAVTTSGDFVMTNGTLTGSADGDFIKAYDLVDIDAGTINAAAKCDGIQSGKALVETTSGTTVTKSDYTTGNIDISGGNITLVTNGGHTTTVSDDADSCKGIKANTELNISGGEFNIDSADDSIHSNWNVTITGGSFTLATGDDGVHADYTLTLGTDGGADEDFNIDITTSYEGIEGSVINMLSGTTYLVASDDGINAAGDYQEGATLSSTDIELTAGPGGPGGNPGGGTGGWGPGWGSDDSSPYGMLYIKGGRCYAEANGDGVDSNGSIEMSGGMVIENGPTSGGNGVFDIGDSSSCYFRITGGTLIGAGTSDMTVTPTVSGQGYAVTSGGMGGRPGQSGGSSGSAGSPVQITTANGTFTFVPKTSWSWMFVTMPEMTAGGSYTITSNSGSTSGTPIFGKTVSNTFYGLIKN